MIKKITNSPNHSKNQQRWASKNQVYIRHYRNSHKAEMAKLQWTWRHTKQGYLSRKYDLMKRRVNGGYKISAHLYENLALLSRQDFYKFSLADPQFNELFAMWMRSNYQVEYAPSIDRIDPQKGYTLDNIRYTTFDDNRLTGLKNELERRKREGKYSSRKRAYVN